MSMNPAAVSQIEAQELLEESLETSRTWAVGAQTTPVSSAKERARRRFRRRRALVHSLLGLLFGYVVLHPLTMAVFAWFETGHGIDPLEFVLDRIVQSFSFDMLPMALVFAAFSAVIGAMDGYYRSLVRYQRDDLARELAVNELYQAELEKQYQSLQELELAKSRMTQFLVHDLKNHLGCVLGYSKLLMSRSPGSVWSGRDKRSLEKIHRQAKKMSGQVKDVLNLARVEQMPKLNLEQVDVSALLTRSVERSALGPGEGSVRIDAVNQSGLTIECDAGLIERVIINLIHNAVRHNGPAVSVTLRADRHDGVIQISCIDDGIGIPAEIRETIFDDFLTAGVSEEISGSFGLGLAYCKAAVKAHGGDIWLDTHYQSGAKFSFTVARSKTRSTTQQKGIQHDD